MLEALALRGYQEAIAFAFVDPVLQTRLFPRSTGVAPSPTRSPRDLSVMQVSLWPGLLQGAPCSISITSRIPSVCSSLGARFLVGRRGPCRDAEVEALASIASGHRLPEQWGLPGEMREPEDFFDLKGDVEALLAATGAPGGIHLRAPCAAPACIPAGRPAAAPGGAGRLAGGAAPLLVKELEFTHAPVLFELDVEAALAVELPAYREISRFPQVRRDLAVVLDESVTLSGLTERVTLIGFKPLA